MQLHRYVTRIRPQMALGLVIALVFAGVTLAPRVMAPSPATPGSAPVMHHSATPLPATATDDPPDTSVPATNTATVPATITPTSTTTPRPTVTATVAPPTATPTPTTTSTPSPTPTPLEPTPDGVLRQVRVPILMYHYVSEPPPGASRLRRDLTVQPDVFEAHLGYLRDAGYTSISLEDLYWHLMTGRSLPDKPIVITFDDCYRDNYEIAFPLLKEYGFTATFFAITDFIDWGNEGYVTWEQLREIQQAGMEIGAHSRDHPDLRGRNVDFLVWQILGPREAIEDHVGVRPRFYSYPSGSYDEKVITVLRSDHYWGAVTTHQGILQSSERPFELRRIRVRGSHGPDDLAWWINYWMTTDNENE